MLTEEQLNNGFIIGEWEVLPQRGVLRKGEHEERPEPLVLKFLLVLAMRDGGLVTKDEIVAELWGRPTADDPITRCVFQARKHLGDKSSAPRYIETLTRRGYRLMQPVRLLAADDKGTAAGSLRPWSRFAGIGTALAVAAIAGVLVWLLTQDSGREGVTSIGVLPCTNVTGRPEDDYLVTGFTAELVHTLHSIPDVVVKSSQLSYSDAPTDTILSDLDVDRVLRCSVQVSMGQLKSSYDITEAGGLTTSVGSVTGAVEALFDLQQQLATGVRNDLVGVSTQQLIARTRPASFDAYDRYMRGLHAFGARLEGDTLDDAIELFRETTEIDPNFGPAYLMLAKAYVLSPVYSSEPLEAMNELAIRTVERGTSVDPSIRDAGKAVLGLVYHRQKRWQLSEQAYRDAVAAAIVDPGDHNWYSRMLASVGRLDASLEQALAARDLDPTSAVINSRVALAYTWLGDTAMADEYFTRANQLGAAGSTYQMGYALFLFRAGRIDEAQQLTRSVAEGAGASTDWIEPVFTALADPSQRRSGLDAITAAIEADQVSRQVEFIARIMLGDVDGAMSVARMLEQPGEAFEMDLLFIPEVKPLRRHPDFLPLMQSLGVSQYWYANDCRFEDFAVVCSQPSRR